MQLLSRDLKLPNPPVLDVIRDSPATYFNQHGILKTVSENWLRPDFDPVTGFFRGWLIEKERTNICLHNRDLSETGWNIPSNITETQDATGLDGVSNTAWTLDQISTGFIYLSRFESVSADTNTHTGYVYLKKDNDETRFPSFYVSLGGNTNRTNINTKTGAIHEARNDSGDSSYVEDAGNWWRLVMPITNTGSGTSLEIRVYPAVNDQLDDNGSFTTGSCVVDFFGIEENSNFATNPIETGASPVTRNADLLRTEIWGVPWPNRYSYVIEAITPKYTGFDAPLISLLPAANNNNLVYLNRHPDGYFIFRTKSFDVLEQNSIPDPGNNTRIRVAFRVKDGDMAVCINGGKVYKHSNTLPAIDSTAGTIHYRNIGYISTYYNGTITSVDEIHRALSDQELQKATKL